MNYFSCPDGSTLQNDMCVAPMTCPAGMVFDTSMGMCVSSPIVIQPSPVPPSPIVIQPSPVPQIQPSPVPQNINRSYTGRGGNRINRSPMSMPLPSPVPTSGPILVPRGQM